MMVDFQASIALLTSLIIEARPIPTRKPPAPSLSDASCEYAEIELAFSASQGAYIRLSSSVS